MRWQFHLPLVLALLVATLIAALVTVGAWHRRRRPGAIFLFFAMAAITEWSLFAALEAAAVEKPLKILMSQLEYIGVVLAPGLMLLFVLIYTRKIRVVRWPMVAGLLIIPIITLCLVWSNDLHGLVWPDFHFSPTNSSILIYQHGVAFWVQIIYDYVIFAIIAILLLRYLFRCAKPFRPMLATMTLASLFPAAAGLIYVFNLSPIPGLDWSPVGGLLTGIFLAWGVYRQNVLDHHPVMQELMVDQLQDGVLLLDSQNCIVESNRVARQLFGANSTLRIGGLPCNALPDKIDFSAQPANNLPTEIHLSAQPPCWIEVRKSSLSRYPDENAGYLVLLRDITAEKEATLALKQANCRLQSQLNEIRALKDQLRNQALHDELTGLYNRHYLAEILEPTIAHANREGKPVSFLVVDIDHFKGVNDLHGHDAGDIVLAQLGKLFLENIRKEDIAVRYGGEEFLIILPGASIKDAELRGEMLRSKYEELSFFYNGEIIRSTFSVGVASYPEDGTSMREVIKAADRAMYRAKALGKNRVEVALPNLTPSL